MSVIDNHTKILILRELCVTGVEMSIKIASRSDYEENSLFNAAAQQLVAMISRAAQRVTQDFRDEHPAINWSRLTQDYHNAVESYDKVDHGMVWLAIHVEIPRLLAQIEQILATEEFPPPVTTDGEVL